MIHRPMFVNVLSLALLKSTRDLEMDHQLGHMRDLENATVGTRTKEIIGLISDSKIMMNAYDDLIRIKIKEQWPHVNFD